MSIEAMKRALKTFEKIHEGCGFVKEDDLHKDAKDLATYVQEDCDFTMRTLRQAIEQAEQWDTSDMAHRSGGLSVAEAEQQEPKAWIYEGNLHIFDPTDWAIEPESVQPLYTAPPRKEWVGLTDEEIAQTVGSPIDEVYLIDFRKVIEKLKERNT